MVPVCSKLGFLLKEECVESVFAWLSLGGLRGEQAWLPSGLEVRLMSPEAGGGQAHWSMPVISTL